MLTILTMLTALTTEPQAVLRPRPPHALRPRSLGSLGFWLARTRCARGGFEAHAGNRSGDDGTLPVGSAACAGTGSYLEHLECVL